MPLNDTTVSRPKPPPGDLRFCVAMVISVVDNYFGERKKIAITLCCFDVLIHLELHRLAGSPRTRTIQSK